MILVDTSAWVEFLRDTGALPSQRSSPAARKSLGGRGRTADYEHAAALYRSCRRGGETVRKLIDCLIGAIAIRADVSVLHSDSDFEVLARHTALRVDQP